MGVATWIKIWSDKPLEFNDSICSCCGATVPVDKVTKKFLSRLNQRFNDEYEIKHGSINPTTSLKNPGFLTNNHKRYSVEDGTIHDKLKLFNVSWLDMGNYTNFSHIWVLAEAFPAVWKIAEFLHQEFPDKVFHYDVTNQTFNEPLIPLTKIDFE